jgi:hypothetical protein
MDRFKIQLYSTIGFTTLQQMPYQNSIRSTHKNRVVPLILNTEDKTYYSSDIISRH